MNITKRFILTFVLSMCIVFIEDYNKNKYSGENLNSSIDFSIDFGEMNEIKKEEILFFNNSYYDYKYNSYIVKEEI
jgi:hypothetical protein